MERREWVEPQGDLPSFEEMESIRNPLKIAAGCLGCGAGIPSYSRSSRWCCKRCYCKHYNSKASTEEKS